MRLHSVIFIIMLQMLALPAAAERYTVVIGDCGYDTIGETDSSYPAARLCCEALMDLGVAPVAVDARDSAVAAGQLEELVDRVRPGDDVVLIFPRRSEALRNGPGLAGAGGAALHAPLLNRAVDARALGYHGIITDLEAAGARVSLRILDTCDEYPFESGSAVRSATVMRGDAPTPVSEGTLPIYTIAAWEYALDNIYDVLPGNMHSVVSRLFLSHHHIITAIGPETFDRSTEGDVISRALAFVAIRESFLPPDELLGITIRQNIRQNVVPEIIIEGTGPTDLIFPLDFPPRLGPPPQPGDSRALDTPPPLDPAQPGTPDSARAALAPAPAPLAPGASTALDTPAPLAPVGARQVDAARNALSGLAHPRIGTPSQPPGTEILNRSALRASVPQNAHGIGTLEDHERLITAYGTFALHGAILNSRAIGIAGSHRSEALTDHDRLASFALAGLAVGAGTGPANTHLHTRNGRADGDFSPRRGIRALARHPVAGTVAFTTADAGHRHNRFHHAAVLGLGHRSHAVHDGGGTMIARSGLRGHGTYRPGGRVMRAGYFR